MSIIAIIIAILAYLSGATTFDGTHYVTTDAPTYALMCIETAEDIAACIDSY